jgi:hypothetical protein
MAVSKPPVSGSICPASVMSKLDRIARGSSDDWLGIDFISVDEQLYFIKRESDDFVQNETILDGE